MSKRQVLTVIGLGAAGLAIYRAGQQVDDAIENYRQRGPRWDVVLFGAIAAVALIASLEQGGKAVRKATVAQGSYNPS